MSPSRRERLGRVLVWALGPALGLVIRFRLPWLLRQRLLAVRPKGWLASGLAETPPPPSPSGSASPVSLVLDARGAGPDALARALASAAGLSPGPNALHVLADHLAEPPAGTRLWPAEHLGELLRTAAAEAGHCLLVIVPQDGGVTFRPGLLGHLLAALESAPGAFLAYCDESVSRGRSIDVFCKPAWDPLLFEALPYVGPAALVNSRLLPGMAARDIPAGGLVDAAVQAAQQAACLVAHVPAPLVHVLAPAHRPHPAPRPAQPSRDSDPARQTPRISVIVPTRDRPDLLGPCLRTLRATVPDPAALELILVDNASACPTALAMLEREEHAGSIVLRDGGAFNFSRLVNQGAGAATGEFLLLLNNDVEFRQPGWLQAMQRLADRPEAGCVGATLSYANCIVQHAGVVLSMYSAMLGEHVAGHLHHGWAADGDGHFGLLRHARTVSAVTAALLMVRTEVFRAAGGFNEALAVALNDVDFCLKVRRLGLENFVAPVDGVVHLESATRNLDQSRDKVERLKAENATLRAAWGTALDDDPFYNPSLSLDISYSLAPAPRPRRPRLRNSRP